MKIVATVEARMRSTRLPGKVLLPAAGKAMLLHLVERLRRVPSLDEVVIATTTAPDDDVLEAFGRQHSLRVHRGSEEDVLQRVVDAAESAQADVVVEITGDCPILDPGITEQVIRIFRSNTALYVSNNHVHSYPDGMDTRVFALGTLKHSAALTDAPLDREHVTLHIRNHPELYPPINVIAPPALHWPHLGLTLDEHSDYLLLRTLIEHFDSAKPYFDCGDVLEALRARPEWLAVNCAVRRKGDT